MPSSDMLPIESTDSPLPQPLDPIEGNDAPLPPPVYEPALSAYDVTIDARNALAGAVTAFVNQAEKRVAAGDDSSAVMLLNAATAAFVALS